MAFIFLLCSILHSIVYRYFSFFNFEHFVLLRFIFKESTRYRKTQCVSIWVNVLSNQVLQQSITEDHVKTWLRQYNSRICIWFWGVSAQVRSWFLWDECKVIWISDACCFRIGEKARAWFSNTCVTSIDVNKVVPCLMHVHFP